MKVLFIHHSTGGLLPRFGRIRELLAKAAPNIEFWDHGYNLSCLPILFRTGLSDAKGKMTGKDFHIVISNNSPREYADIFSRNSDDQTLSQILNFDVVIFKNCFPTSKIETTEKLEKYKAYYRKIFQAVGKYPSTFIAFTPPPLRREMTNATESANARALATWMENEGARRAKNCFVFNFFDLLADKEGDNKNMLKREYCSFIPFDSHPNIRANREAGKIFVGWLTARLK
jgi:hypothetical protein